MHPVLDKLLAQHRDLARLIALLELQPSLQPDPEAPYVSLLVDVLEYLTNFPDVTHHPLEDRIAERLVDLRVLDADSCKELEAQHAQLAQQGSALLRDMEGAMRKESVSLELVALNSGLYAERLRLNISFEEQVLFPCAARNLSDAELQEIAGNFRGPADPLFMAVIDRRFAALRAVISAEAGCGCVPEA